MVDRMDRVNELVRQEVSRIVLTGLKDPRMRMVTVTRVKVSKDLRVAKVYFTIMGDEDAKQRTAVSLKAASGRVRRLLGNVIRLRYIPEIVFMYDESFEAGERVFEVLRELKRTGQLPEREPDPPEARHGNGDAVGGERRTGDYDDVLEIIEGAERFFLTTHVRPDGDAIGSLAALGRVLRAQGRRVRLALQDDVPEVYRFLTEGLRIVTELPPYESYDVAILLDVATFARSGLPGLQLNRAGTVINIDHHVDNERFGDVNLVVPGASSTGEILFELFRRWDVPVDAATAANLYAAIMTDTGRFSYENTTPACLRAAADLVEKGMDVTAISNRLYNAEPLPRMRLLGAIITGMEIDLERGIASCFVDGDLLESLDATFEHTDDVISYLRAIHGVEVALMFKEVAENTIHVSFRSKDFFDVNRFAGRFGGGGHQRAAGCTIKGTVDEVKGEVLGELGRVLETEKELPR